MGKSLIATALLFKALLAAGWIATLVLVEKITATRPLRERCLAAALIGWVPLGVTQTLAEGHNDIAMAVFALLWIHLLLRGRMLAPVALAASILSKYVTGPLVIVDAIAALRLHRLSWRQFLLRLVAPALFGLAVFAVFYRSLAFFDGTRLVNEWRFLLPTDAIGAIEDLLDIPLFPEYVIGAAFAALAAYHLYALVRTPAPDQVVRASLAILSAISFSLIAHIWPWYLVWMIGFAAILPGWWLARFIVGVSLLAPFTLAVWWVDDLGDYAEWAALIMYVGALLWTALTRTPAERRAPAPPAGEVKPATQESAGRS